MAGRGFDALEFGSPLYPLSSSGFWTPSDSESLDPSINLVPTETRNTEEKKEEEDTEENGEGDVSEPENDEDQEEERREQEREYEERLRNSVTAPAQNDWAEGASKRGFRGDRMIDYNTGNFVPAGGKTGGWAYELALKLTMANPQRHSNEQERRIIDTRLKELTDRNNPKPELWFNERMVLSTVRSRDDRLRQGKLAQLVEEAKNADKPKEKKPQWVPHHKGDLCCQFGRWWIYDRSEWKPFPIALAYGQRPVAAMQKFLLALMTAWKTDDTLPDMVPVEKKFRVTERIELIIRDGKIQPFNAEIRRVLGLPDLEEKIYIAKTVEEIKAALLAKTRMTLGEIPMRGRMKRAEELDVGDRSWLQSMEGIGRPELIWTGTEWQPVESWLRRALKYDLLTNFFRT